MLVRAVLVVCLALPAAAEEPVLTPYTVDSDRSVLAFVTYKAGFLSGFTENVITTPAEYRVDLRLGEESADSQFAIEIDARTMVFNDPDAIDRWFRAMRASGILEEPPDALGRFRRRRAERAMFSNDMLDTDNYPVISARTTAILAQDGGETDATHRIRLEVTIRGRTVPVEWPARVHRDGDGVTVETHGPLKFSEFGMDAYSSFLGAVKYRDDFEVFAHFDARRGAPGDAAKGH